MNILNRKHYWEMTEDDGLTPEQVKRNRHLHKLIEAKKAGIKMYVVTTSNDIINIKQ